MAKIKIITVKDIVKEFLQKNGFDGLGGEYCGCLIDDLAPCDNMDIHICCAGYKVPCPNDETCPDGGGCDWHISIQKDKRTEMKEEGTVDRLTGFIYCGIIVLLSMIFLILLFCT